MILGIVKWLNFVGFLTHKPISARCRSRFLRSLYIYIIKFRLNKQIVKSFAWVRSTFAPTNSPNYMCLYPKLIKNPKYLPNKKNNNNPPVCNDERLLYVPIACGKCEECCKKKAREWQIRLNEELKCTKKCTFVTLTFSNENLEELCKEQNTTENNAIATIAVRRFLERHRKKYGKSIRHWLITEMGHKSTERIHLHGLLWDIDENEIEKIWQYGFVYIGEYVNNRTINYIVKYINKIDNDHKNFQPVILTSKGIGRNYIENPYSLKHKFKKNETNENYRLNNGDKIQIPIYYRNYLYTEEEREQLWIEKLDKKIRYINGQKISIATEKGIKLYESILKQAQKNNERKGFGNDKAEWKKKKYNVTLRKLNLYNNKQKSLKKYLKPIV